MRILSRYILSELLVALGSWVAFLFLLLSVMQILRSSSVLLGSAVHPSDVFQVVADLAPHFLSMALPVAFLLAILIALGRLSEDRELVAMASVGISPSRILVTPMLLAVVLCGVMGWLVNGADPHGLSEAKVHLSEVIKRNVVGDVKPGRFYDDLPRLVLYSEQVKGGGWTHVLLHDDRDPKAPLLVLARRGKVIPAKSGAALTLSLFDGDIHRAERGGPDYSVIHFRQADIAVGVQDSIFHQNRLRSPREELTPRELLETADEAKRAGKSPLPLRVAFWQRLASILAPLAFALVGGPLALGGRQARGRGYLFTLGAYVAYYVLTRIFGVWGEQGHLAPWVAGWAADLVFAGVGLWLLRRVSRARAA